MATPFPVTEATLCYFSAYLAQSGLAPSSIKVYLAAVRHAQVLMGMPEPRALSSLPRLKLVLNGIARSRVTSGAQQKPRLPVTIHVLQKLFTVLRQAPMTFDTAMLWAACALCFFGFFRAGEITVPNRAGFIPSVHLSWGDVRTDSTHNPSCIQVHLKVSKCDQAGRGVKVYVGKVEGAIVPRQGMCSIHGEAGPRTGPILSM